MDTTQLTHISLCSGYGGIDLGLRRVLPGLRTVAYAEIEEFACGLLAARMESGHLDAGPIWPNVRTFPWHQFRGKVDILSGGYPCQPFSAAGLRKGADDPRHLWPAIADGISVLQPALCFFENVEGHISLGLQDVLRDLGSRGYTATWGIFSAAEVGAPHQRKRVFILAYKQHQGSQGWLQRWADSQRESQQGHTGRCGSSGGVWPSRPGQPQHGWEPPRVVADSHGCKPSQERGNDGEVCSVSEAQCQSEHGSRLLGGKGTDGTESVGDQGRELDDTSSDGHGSPHSIPAGRESVVSTSIVGDSYGAGPLDDKQSKNRWPTKSVAKSSDKLGDADCRGQSPSLDTGSSCEANCRGQGDVKQADDGQTQPTLGGNAHGPSGGMGYAELCVSCDNRTDELRLLGNGVVPACAAVAFTTLMQELFP